MSPFRGSLTSLRKNDAAHSLSEQAEWVLARSLLEAAVNHPRAALEIGGVFQSHCSCEGPSASRHAGQIHVRRQTHVRPKHIRREVRETPLVHLPSRSVCVCVKPISTSSGEYVCNYIMCKRCFEATLLSSVQRHSTSCQWRYVNSQESYYFSHVIFHIKQL